jgi:hypothetical protein
MSVSELNGDVSAKIGFANMITMTLKRQPIAGFRHRFINYTSVKITRLLQIVIVGKCFGVALYPLPRNATELQGDLMATLKPFLEELDAYCLLGQPGFEQFMLILEQYSNHIHAVTQLFTPNHPAINGESVLLHHKAYLEIHTIMETVAASELKPAAANVLSTELMLLSSLLVMLDRHFQRV